MNLKKLVLPLEYNYIGCFLTLNCNLKCEYCINYFGGVSSFSYSHLSGNDWIRGLNRLVLKDNLPVTLQGGEPALYPDFIQVINGLKPDLNIDILTNLCFDVDNFIREVKPQRLNRNAPYANIRVSYHPNEMDLKELIKKVLKLQNSGYSVGVYGITHPMYKDEILKADEICKTEEIDFRTKDFLGEFKGEIYGYYKYLDAVFSKERKACLCRSTDLIIAPNGDIFRCHHDLYKNFPDLGNIVDEDLKIEYKFRSCYEYGDCNPCDIKIKTDRFQVFGHTAVDIEMR